MIGTGGEFLQGNPRQLVRSALNWWLSELGDMLPTKVRRHLRRIGQHNLIELTPYEIVLNNPDSGETDRLPRPVDDKAWLSFRTFLQANRFTTCSVELTVPESSILSRTIDLPLTPTRHIRALLLNELDRRTPFDATQVYFDFSVLQRDLKRSRMTLTLAMLPREPLKPLLKVMDELELRLSSIRPVIREAVSQSLNFVSDPNVPRAPVADRRLLIALIGGCFLAMAMLCALHVVHKVRASELQQQEIDAAQHILAATDSLKSKIAVLQKKVSFVSEARADNRAAAAFVELTKILPDSCWLTDFTIEDDKVAIRGVTQKASALIAIVGASALFTEVHFDAPIIPADQPGKERFSLAFHLTKASTS